MVKKIKKENSFIVKQPELFQILTKEEFHELHWQ